MNSRTEAERNLQSVGAETSELDLHVKQCYSVVGIINIFISLDYTYILLDY